MTSIESIPSFLKLVGICEKLPPQFSLEARLLSSFPFRMLKIKLTSENLLVASINEDAFDDAKFSQEASG